QADMTPTHRRHRHPGTSPSLPPRWAPRKRQHSTTHSVTSPCPSSFGYWCAHCTRTHAPDSSLPPLQSGASPHPSSLRVGRITSSRNPCNHTPLCLRCLCHHVFVPGPVMIYIRLTAMT